MNYYLDTNICIYFLKGIYPALLTKMLMFNPSNIKIPAVVKAELFYGAEKSARREQNLGKINAFLSPFEIVPFDDSATAHYGIIRSALEKAGTPIGPNDMFIAATVLSGGGILVTNNTDEFGRVPAIRMENWV